MEKIEKYKNTICGKNREIQKWKKNCRDKDSNPVPQGEAKGTLTTGLHIKFCCSHAFKFFVVVNVDLAAAAVSSITSYVTTELPLDANLGKYCCVIVGISVSIKL